jgi:hypothetical protein
MGDCATINRASSSMGFDRAPSSIRSDRASSAWPSACSVTACARKHASNVATKNPRAARDHAAHCRLRNSWHSSGPRNFRTRLFNSITVAVTWHEELSNHCPKTLSSAQCARLCYRMQRRFGHDQKTASDPRILEHRRPRNNQQRTFEHGIWPRTFEHPIQPRIVSLAFGLLGYSEHPLSRIPTSRRRIHAPLAIMPSHCRLRNSWHSNGPRTFRVRLFNSITFGLTRIARTTNHYPRATRDLGFNPWFWLFMCGHRPNHLIKPKPR